MKKFETILTSCDGLDLFCQGWEPEQKPKSLVCLVHGLGEHSGRYAHVAAAFVQAGCAIITFDLRGHGRSGGQRGHGPTFEVFMQDVAVLLEEADRRYPDLPRFLYGHSLGGILVLNYTLSRKPELNGVIATASGLRTALEQQTGKVFLAKMLGMVAPTASLASGLDPQTLSRDAETVAAYKGDPLIHYSVSFAMAKNILEAIHWAFEHAHEFPVPLLLMHGTADQLAFPCGSQEFATLAPNTTLKLWEGLYHEIHNEPEKEHVLRYALDWLEKSAE